LLACGNQLSATKLLRSGTYWSAIAIANQVDYDIALIQLARSLGLDCDPETFFQPERRREELRQQIIGRGIHLDELDHPARSTPTARQWVTSGPRAVNPR
jgi:hypothetical protein